MKSGQIFFGVIEAVLGLASSLVALGLIAVCIILPFLIFFSFWPIFVIAFVGYVGYRWTQKIYFKLRGKS